MESEWIDEVSNSSRSVRLWDAAGWSGLRLETQKSIQISD